MRITVYGFPAPQGSKRYVGRTKMGRGILVENSDAVTPWRADVMTACRGVLEEWGWPAPMDGPIQARMVFTVPKPKSAPKTRRTWPVSRPGDLSKLVRATEDALQAAGVIKDDGMIVEYFRIAKVYPGEDLEAMDRPGCQIALNYHPGYAVVMEAGRPPLAIEAA